MSDILSILAAANSNKTGVAVTAKAVTSNSLDYGSMDAVRAAIFAGSNVFKINFNFKKDVPFGPKEHLAFFGGALRCRNEGDGAFAEFIPTSINAAGKTMSTGTSSSITLKQKPTAEQMAQISLLNDQAKAVFYESLIQEVDYDYDAWQAMSVEHFGSEIKIQINVPNWNASFVEALSEARDADPEDMIRSMTVYMSLDKEDGASVDLNTTDILKAKSGQVVQGKLVQPKIFACFFYKEIHRSARFEGSIGRNELSSTVANINAMKAELNTASSLAQQVASAGKKGNKAVSNAKTTFETRLESEGIWNSFVEAELMELAKCTQFPGWSILAAKTYFAKMSNQYPDADYVEEKVSTRNTANAIKNNPVVADANAALSSSMSSRLA